MVRVELLRIIKLLCSLIEPLEESNSISSSNRKPAIHIPIHIEKDAIIIELFLPEDFTLFAIN